tara:strand:- start:3496 stop:3750 length:255 start_codon:yes stop_codon:yes gene_type:complete
MITGAQKTATGNYVERNIHLDDVYAMVADSLAVITNDRGEARIRAALASCLTALRKDGYWFAKTRARAAVRSVQKKLEAHPAIE